MGNNPNNHFIPTKCTFCRKTLGNDFVTPKDRVAFHPGCFKCLSCSSALTLDTFVLDGALYICKKCSSGNNSKISNIGSVPSTTKPKVKKSNGRNRASSIESLASTQTTSTSSDVCSRCGNAIFANLYAEVGGLKVCFSCNPQKMNNLGSGAFEVSQRKNNKKPGSSASTRSIASSKSAPNKAPPKPPKPTNFSSNIPKKKKPVSVSYQSVKGNVSKKPKKQLSKHFSNTCPICAASITQGKKEVEGVNYHAKCFRCKRCDKKLASIYHRISDKQFYCDNCITSVAGRGDVKRVVSTKSRRNNNNNDNNDNSKDGCIIL